MTFVQLMRLQSVGLALGRYNQFVKHYFTQHKLYIKFKHLSHGGQTSWDLCLIAHRLKGHVKFRILINDRKK